MSLYQITNELQSLIDLAEKCADDAEMSHAVEEHMAAIDEALEAKAESYACLIRTLEARSEARKQEAARMTALSKTDNALAERLKFYLRESMVRTGRTKINTDKFRLSVVNNGGKIPIVITDEEAISEEFKKTEFVQTLDKDLIRLHLEQGATVSGAKLGERGQRLDIK